MKKRKLTLNRETVRQLSNQALEPANGAARNQSIQSGETYCWCTDGCETQVAAR